MIELEYSPFFRNSLKFLDSILPDDKVLVISSLSADGICSAVILKYFLKKIGANFRFYFLSEEDDKERSIKTLIERESPKYVILLDLSLDNLLNIVAYYPELSFLYIDHNLTKLPEEVSNLVFLDVRALKLNKLLSTSSIIWLLISKLDKDLKKLSWIAAIGALGDNLLENDYYLLKSLKEDYPYLLSEISVHFSIILASIVLNNISMYDAYRAMSILEYAYEKENPILAISNNLARKVLLRYLCTLYKISKNLQRKLYNRGILTYIFVDDIKAAIDILKIIGKVRNRLLLLLKPIYSGVLSKIFKKPTFFDFYLISSLEKVNIGEIIVEIVSNYADSYGRGYHNLAYGRIRAEFLQEFIETIIKKIKEQEHLEEREKQKK